ncbi:MAG: Fic/DOC family N-terminal domain-containing protein [Phycisphaerae bacterium]|jgi:Fic family protein
MAKPVKYHYGKFPPKKIDWSKLVPLIGPANAALARYDATLSVIPNATILLSPMTMQEAVLSSKIEGTQATMGEVLEYQAQGKSADIPDSRKKDFKEVLNYRMAIRRSINLLKDLPLCQRLICEAHKSLMHDVRGADKTPGQYRRIQNYIGKPGCSVEQARFVPISLDKLQEGMGDWDKYIHDKTVADKLVHLAILHAEFEAIHPFLDGNGRMGRMFVPLFINVSGLIKSPMFYISAYFEANRDEYYDRLLAVSRDDDWTGWCTFFLKAVEVQATANQQKASDILSLYERKKIEIQNLTHSQYTMYALDFIFKHPIFKSTNFVNSGKISSPSARKILSDLHTGGIIKVLTQASGRRPALYVFAELMNTAEGKKVF